MLVVYKRPWPAKAEEYIKGDILTIIAAVSKNYRLPLYWKQ